MENFKHNRIFDIPTTVPLGVGVRIEEVHDDNFVPANPLPLLIEFPE